MEPTFRLLVIADVHYLPTAETIGANDRHREYGREFVRRAIEDAKRRGGFDAIALLGDLVDNGAEPGAEGWLAELRDEVREAAPDAPLLVAPGNHDISAEMVLKVFGTKTGLIELGGYRFVIIVDPYEPGDFCTRRQSDLDMMTKIAATPGGPIIALQHNILNPWIDFPGYPLNMLNREQVLENYSKAGVLLSISGHYHEGYPLHDHMGVKYLTVMSLCSQGFNYGLVTLAGREVKAEIRKLAVPEGTKVVDCHCHTEFAYCGRGISTATAIDRAGKFGVSGVCLVEHSPQLYIPEEDFWKGRHVYEPELWRAMPRPRVEQFREAAGPLRSETVHIGMEVELDAAGNIIIRDEDRDWVDMLVGAIHWMPRDNGKLDRSETIAEFMRTNEALIGRGVDVLAHPFRVFPFKKLGPAPELYAPLADMLAGSGTAAELNFHVNRPDIDFFAMCVDRGVKIALASDAHWPWEEGGFSAHLAMLERIVPRDRLADVLYMGPRKR